MGNQPYNAIVHQASVAVKAVADYPNALFYGPSARPTTERCL